MTADVALGSGDVTTLGVGLTAALVVVGLLLVMAVKALVVRVVTVAVVIVLGVVVWQQREHVEDAYSTRNCDLGATYFGIHLDAPDSVRRACEQRGQS